MLLYLIRHAEAEDIGTGGNHARLRPAADRARASRFPGAGRGVRPPEPRRRRGRGQPARPRASDRRRIPRDCSIPALRVVDLRRTGLSTSSSRASSRSSSPICQRRGDRVPVARGEGRRGRRPHAGPRRPTCEWLIGAAPGTMQPGEGGRGVRAVQGRPRAGRRRIWSGWSRRNGEAVDVRF